MEYKNVLNDIHSINLFYKQILSNDMFKDMFMVLYKIQHLQSAAYRKIKLNKLQQNTEQTNCLDNLRPNYSQKECFTQKFILRWAIVQYLHVTQNVLTD